MSDHLVVPPHVYDQLHPDDPAVKRRAEQAETNRQIAHHRRRHHAAPAEPRRTETPPMSEFTTALERILQDEVDTLSGKLAVSLFRGLTLCALLEDATDQNTRLRAERDQALAERDHAREWCVTISSTPDWRPE